MSISIFAKSGYEKAVLHKFDRTGAWMGEKTITADLETPQPIVFNPGDFVEYRGERYVMEQQPSVKKESSDKIIYSLRFVSYKYELERCQMRDLVPYDNGVVYPTPLAIEFTGKVNYLTERIQACLDAMYGVGVWTITIGDRGKDEEKNISMQSTTCWNALSLVYSEYGLYFYIKGRNITVTSQKGETIDHHFRYGMGNGLYTIDRNADTSTAIVTKLRAYGGTRNLDYSYPKQPEYEDSVLPSTYNLYPLRVMLPTFKLDGKTDYILASDAAVALYGIREATITYDDIYPSITGATNSAGQRIDQLAAVEEVTSETQPTFKVTTRPMDFKNQTGEVANFKEDLLTSETPQLVFKTGTLQGYAFNIVDAITNEDGSYQFTLGRGTLSESGEDYYVPNVDWNATAGDEFVLLHILMPKKYILDAEQRLKIRAQEYLEQYSKTNFSYFVSISEAWMIQSGLEDITEGMVMVIDDPQFGWNGVEVTIQSVTVKEGETNGLPKYEVTLNNNPTASTLERIQGQLDSLEGITSLTFSSSQGINAQYRKKLDKAIWDSAFILHYDDTKDPKKVTSIQALADFWSNGEISAGGKGSGSGGGGGEGGASALYQLLDVSPNATGDGVLGAEKGKVLTYNGTHWYADNASGLDESALEKYLTDHLYATQNWVTLKLANKVDVVVGKELSSNDFTDSLKAKLEGLQNYSLPTASATVLGGVKVGTTLAIADGILNLKAGVVGAGTYGKVTVDTYGRVTAGSSLNISDITGLQNALDTKLDKSVFETYFNKDSNGDIYVVGAKNFYTDGEISAGGKGSGGGGGGGGGSDYERLDAWSDYDSSKSGYVLSAGLGWDLNSRVKALEGGQITLHSLTIQKNGSNVGTYNPGTASAIIDIAVPTKTSELTNDSSFITAVYITGLIGKPNGITPLGPDGLIPTSYLPSYVSDVFEYDNLASFPSKGESNKIYIAKDTGKTYRWSGTTYVVISETLALGETAQTAYAGNKGKANADAISALRAITINAGAGLTGGGNLTANRTIALATSGVTAGTYTKVTVDVYGRVTNGTTLVAGDVPSLAISKITGLQTALDNKLDKSDFASYFAKDTNGDIYVVGGKNLYTEGEVSAGGKGSGSGGGGGLIQSVYKYTDLGGTFDASDLTSTFNADTTNRLASRITALESGAAVNVTMAGTGAALVSIAKSGSTITATKGDLPFGSLTGKPTTLAGYGITDAMSLTAADGRYVKKAGDIITGVLQIKDGSGIHSTDGNALLFNNGTASSTVGMKLGTTYIRSGATNLMHTKGDVNEIILDTANYKSYAPAVSTATPTTDLNDFNGFGMVANTQDVNAGIGENHYPVGQAGSLFYCTAAYGSANQIYGTYSSNRWFVRGSGTSSDKKTSWVELVKADGATWNISISGSTSWAKVTNTITANNEFNFVTSSYVGGVLYINYKAIDTASMSAGAITGYQFCNGQKNTANVRLYATNGFATIGVGTNGAGAIYGPGAMRLQHATPSIDFCFGSTATVTSRIVESTSGTLQFTKNVLVSGYAYFGSTSKYIANNGWAFLNHSVFTGHGNTYTTGGLEVRGNGTTSAYPLIGFHQPNVAASCISMMNNGDFGFTDGSLAAFRRVQAQSFIGNDLRFNTCLAFYNSVSETVTGTFCITLPNGFNSSMNLYEIDIYEYAADTARNNATITIGGYNYSGSKEWFRSGYRTSGGYNKGVRLAYDGSHCVILLGKTTSTWSYPQVFLRQVLTGFSSQATWYGGYTISVLTSESGLSYITNPPLASQFFGPVNASSISSSGSISTGGSLSIAGTTTSTGRIYANGGIRANIGGTEDWTAAGVFACADTYPLALHGRNGGTNTRRYYFAVGSGRLGLSSMNDSSSYIASIADFYHNGDITFYHALTVNGATRINSNLYVVGILDAEGTIRSYGSPGFYNQSNSGVWAYLRLRSGATYWDLAVKNDDSSGAFQIRYAGGAAQKYVFDTTMFYFGTNNSSTLGTTSYRWKNIYSVNADISGTLSVTALNAQRIGITNTSETTGYGISLYGGNTSGMPTYGIAFAGTATFSKHGEISGNWATYFTMDNTANRGWIFKRGSTNVASVDGYGNIAYNGWVRNISANQGMYSPTGDARWYYSTARGGWYADKQIFTNSSFNIFDTTLGVAMFTTAPDADRFVCRRIGANGSYAYEVILLCPAVTVTNQSGGNKIQGRFIFCTNGANQYGYADVMVQCNYNTVLSSIESGNTRINTPFTLATCTYNGVKYICLKVPYAANRWDQIYFYGTVYSQFAGGYPSNGTKMTALPICIKYKTAAHESIAQVINNAEINNSLSDTIVTSPITSHQSIQQFIQHHFAPYMNNALDCGAAAYRWRYVYGVDGNFNGTVQATNGLISYGNLSVSGTSAFSGRATFSGGITSGYSNTSYQVSVSSFICNSWVRTTGVTGWYNETYGGGIYMTDSTYVRVYNSKRFLVPNTESTDFSDANSISASGGIHAWKNITANGYIAAMGEVSAGATSDFRLKKRFSTEDYQQRVLNLGMVQDFEYRKDKIEEVGRRYKPGRHTSLVAQNIRSCLSMVRKDNDGYFSINNLDPDFMFTVVGAVQLNVLGLRAVKGEVEKLKEEISTLKKRIETLEKGMPV